MALLILVGRRSVSHSPMHCDLVTRQSIKEVGSSAFWVVNTLKPRQNGRHFADDTFKRIFVNEIVSILIEISLKFVPKGPINNIPSLVQIIAWRRPGDKPLSEPMMVCLLTHICVTRPQWVKTVDGAITSTWIVVLSQKSIDAWNSYG